MTKSTKWFLGILAIMALIVVGSTLLVLLFISKTTTRTEVVTTGSGDKIAVVELRGIITSAEDIVRQFKKYREDQSIKAVLLRIDSPGGSAVASQEMYEEVKKTRDSGKPVVVSMGSLAASGGYYVACGSSRLVANPGTLTGSIGVISEFLQLHEVLDKIGIDVKTIKSGKMKDAGSQTRKMTVEDQKYFQSLLDDVHDQFIEVVETERKLNHEDALALADGRVFTGKQALQYGLVDTLGTFEDAIIIAAELAGIDGEPAIVRERERRLWWESIFGDITKSVKEMKKDIFDRPIVSYRFDGPF
ncbi:MAG: signal peptide peptidase SppA [Ignavibacteria bacterium]|nr:signal peptide peptidase SppA [Ignavibacteria bacterium]